jgi:hypothetical protein
VSTSSITGTAVRDLAATITRDLDADKDGKLSATEFEGFLSDFLGALQGKSSSGGTATQALFSMSGTATATATAPAKVGTMAGFDAAKLANSAHNSFKYEIGRILQGHQNTPAGLRDALPEIQQLVPGAKIVGSKGDKLDFGNYVDNKGVRIGVVDVIQASGLGGTAWQWIPD